MNRTFSNITNAANGFAGARVSGVRPLPMAEAPTEPAGETRIIDPRYISPLRHAVPLN